MIVLDDVRQWLMTVVGESKLANTFIRIPLLGIKKNPIKFPPNRTFCIQGRSYQP
jgi:hypothetical protein